MDFEEVIKKRQSTRMFSDKKLEIEKLDKILEAGRIAPTAKNNQPLKIYVINSEEGLKKLDNASRCRYNSPAVLLVCGNIDQAFVKEDGHSSYEVDASICATHMMLEATNLGVDNIWVALFDEEKLRIEFDIPKNIIPVCLIPLGYKDENCPPSPRHNIRKNIEEIVEYK